MGLTSGAVLVHNKVEMTPQAPADLQTSGTSRSALCFGQRQRTLSVPQAVRRAVCRTTTKPALADGQQQL